MKSTVYAKNVNVSVSCTCDQLVLMREGINKMITRIRYWSCSDSWTERLWILKSVWIFKNCSFFAHFVAYRKTKQQRHHSPPPKPSSFLLSLASVLMTKGAPRERTFHAKLLRCPAWAGVREGGGLPQLETERLKQEPLLFPKVEGTRDKADLKER